MNVMEPKTWSPLCLLLAGCLANLGTAEETQTSKEKVVSASKETGGAVGSKSWPVPRGDAQSTGFAKQTLPENLVVRWEFKADEAIETTPVVADNRVFVADVMGKVYAIDRKDGSEIWKVDFETGFLAGASVRGQQVLIGDIDGNLYCLDAATGKENWRAQTDGEINGSVAFHQGNVVVTSQDGKLYCFSAKSGEPVWTYQTEDQIRCSPTEVAGRTFLGGCDGQLHVVDLNTGEAIGEPLPLQGPTGSTPSVKGSRVVLPIMDGVVTAFDWKTQEQMWKYEDEDRAQEYRNSAAVGGDLVIVSSQYKQVDALSLETGERVWRHTLRRRADASPVIAGDDVWIASTDGRLIRLSLKDGTNEKWSFEIRGAFLAGPAIVGDELIISDDEGVVRCFAAEK